MREDSLGPRTLDVDILLYGNEIIEEDNLIIPHPRMTERAFVLIPQMILHRKHIEPRPKTIENLVIADSTVKRYMLNDKQEIDDVRHYIVT